MRQNVILGSLDTKRTIYLKKAAEQEGLPITFVEWKRWTEHHFLRRCGLVVLLRS